MTQSRSESTPLNRWIALVRAPAERLEACELTHVAREPIDVALAHGQHEGYCKALGSLGIEVQRLPGLPEHPDSVFVEDVAVVLDEVAIVTRPGAASRRDEVRGLDEYLAPFRTVARIPAPARLDGGDVLLRDRQIWIGRSSRTDDAGIDAFREIAQPHGYEVETVAMPSALHLKTAVGLLPDNSLLVRPEWLPRGAFAGIPTTVAPPGEPFGANVLTLGTHVVLPAEHPETAALLREKGFLTVPVPYSEPLKAEAGVTCASIVFAAGLPSISG